MRPLEWERVLSEHRIPYVSRGPNVKRGEVNIACPFCGSADPSQHMGISLETGWWSCWRNRAQHSGKSPLRLLMRLLRVPYAQAREIAGLGKDYVDPEGFDAIAARFMGRGGDARPGSVQRRVLELDPAFDLISSRQRRTKRYWDYLFEERGFNGSSAAGEDVDVLCELYRLHSGGHSKWVDRIVLPYYQDGELVTWSGRAINGSRYRYLDLPVDDSICPPKETLFNHDALYSSGKALVIVEGPMDALKLDFYGRPWGVRAVALSTNSVSEEQGFLLQPAVAHFQRRLVMMDNASVLGLADSMRLRQELAFLPDTEIVPVPFGRKDAGELKPREVIEWAKSL